MQLYFARHGESVNNSLEGHAHYYTRRKPEPELSARGREQAACLAQLLRGESRASAGRHRQRRNPWNHTGFDVTHLYTSLQLRAVETAGMIADEIDLDPVAWSDIHECGGVLEYDSEQGTFRGGKGATVEELKQCAPRLFLGPLVGADIGADGWWGGRDMEGREVSVERADRVYRTLLDLHGGTDDRVLLVSHSMFYVFFMCRVLGIQFTKELWFTLNNAGLTRIDIGDGDDYEPGIDAMWRKLPGLPVRIEYTNRLDHMPPELVS